VPKTVIVSNRLSVSVEKKEGAVSIVPSLGGLATGLSSVFSRGDTVWLGWGGIPAEELNRREKEAIRDTLLREHASIPVSLSRKDLQEYYYGFCNRTLWPLFHYFALYTEYDPILWEAYRRVNNLYFENLSEIARPGDTIWIHDYQLLLLPLLIKQSLPESQVGLFLHVPFPSFELFRLLPWRRPILEGMLGADLIGLHTYDYARHFLSSVRRILGFEHDLGTIRHGERFTHVDAFPMGIDYHKYAGAAREEAVRVEIDAIRQKVKDLKVVLSVDRLDYTKGVPLRLRAFDLFLHNHPEYQEKVTLILVAAPSRTRVPQYMELKRTVDELVSVINGKYGTMGWVPVWYFYRPMAFHQLTALYSLADVLLVTPIRDGMNLIAKEYIATRTDRRGVLILSETAGASRELGEAMIVNPNNIEEVAESLKTALELPEEVQRENNAIMHERLERYDVRYWVKDFLEKLSRVAEYRNRYLVRRLTEPIQLRMREEYRRAASRLILLDYDGTLVPYADRPERARPDPQLLELLTSLAGDPRNELVMISGRGKGTMHLWFGGLDAGLIAGHGIWYRERGAQWQLMEPVSGEWKEVIRPILQLYRDRTPGSLVEEKDYSLAWHYRKAEPELAFLRQNELKEVLREYTANLNLTILEANKVLEVKNVNINKGRAASIWISRRSFEFVAAFGDDQTDEDLFALLPGHGYSVKVGYDISIANYFVESPYQVRRVLLRLVEP
jgi:trehalose 6-phosphate synthase/phosphatase